MVVVQRQCNACGILISKSNKSPECGACELVSYCSKECQRADWKEGGHKHACKHFPLEKQIVLELFELEVKFLHGLSNKSKKLLLGHAEYKKKKNKFPIHHYSVSGKMALVLAKVSPCCVVHNTKWTHYASKFYDEVAHPWFTKHEAFLSEKGFDLRRLPADAVPHEDITYSEDGIVRYGNGVLFADRNSDYALVVDTVFNRVGDEMTTPDQLAACFGIPPPDWEDEREHVITYLYQQPDPEVIFKVARKDICCTPCFEYWTTEDRAVEIGEHFRRCQLAMNRFGFSINFEIGSQESWDDEELAKAWVTAGGGDYDTTRYFLEERPHFRIEEREVSPERMNHIMHIIYHMAEESSTSS